MTIPRILVTGSRYWPWHQAHIILSVLQKAVTDLQRDPDQPVTLVHGAARGVDTIAARWWARQGWPVDPHPADWRRYGPSAGHRRNASMVALGADLCLAFPRGRSPGTRGCIELARRAGIPVIRHRRTAVITEHMYIWGAGITFVVLAPAFTAALMRWLGARGPAEAATLTFIGVGFAAAAATFWPVTVPCLAVWLAAFAGWWLWQRRVRGRTDAR
ncbi:Protein of unknown function [Pseudonocardia thermophila]|uniref:YspA cpYpsA-related SLOG domain-containing protein n=1 Tax=Pseudonocardia thermophila TaxID=1848 RepID=A0A1M7AX70_PSETH|nr:DUF2493 domain-containing protein [Pseudonocardia thermophila]SHL47019.1 Protein of unknown function [Pseudonocardia thermophila]